MNSNLNHTNLWQGSRRGSPSLRGKVLQESGDQLVGEPDSGINFQQKQEAVAEFNVEVGRELTWEFGWTKGTPVLVNRPRRGERNLNMSGKIADQRFMNGGRIYDVYQLKKELCKRPKFVLSALLGQ